MLSRPDIVATEHMKAAVVRMTIPRSEIMTAMRAAVEELRHVLGAQGVSIAGPMFSHHLRMSPDEFDFEAGFPIEGEFRNEGRVVLGELPAGRAVRVTYIGGYEGLSKAWAEFARMGLEHPGPDVRPADDLWESYVVGPESGLDPGQWRTDLYQPLLP